METTKQIADPGRIAEAIAYEKAVLGGAMLEPVQLQKLLGELEPVHFYLSDHQRIYRAMIELNGEHEPVDFLTVHERCGGKDSINAVRGSFGEFFSLYDAACFSSLFDYALERIKAAAARRRAQAMLQNAMTELGQFDTDLVASFKNMSDDVVQMIAPHRKISRLGDSLIETLKDIDRVNPQSFVRTGIEPLDGMVGGFFPGQLWIIAGRTSMGKSSLAQTIALNVARSGVGYMAIEDGEADLRKRLVGIKAGVSVAKINKGDLSAYEASLVAAVQKQLDGLPFFILEREYEWNKIRARVEILKFQFPEVKVVIIDYLGCIRYSRYKNRWENIAEVTVECKRLAGELGLAIVLLCQINRETEKRKNHHPTLADLRDSGSVEQDADVILLIYRKSYYDSNADDSADVLVAKQRNGPTGAISLCFDRESLKFS